MNTLNTTLPFQHCQICDKKVDVPEAKDLGTARGNTDRFVRTRFNIWKCPQCHSIHNLDQVDFDDIYTDYPLDNRPLDMFARRSMQNLINRLKPIGLKKSDTILDFACGNGVFIQFLNQLGYKNVAGYDPYIPDFAKLPTDQAPFDCVVANDVIEHCQDPREMIKLCSDLTKPGGIVYISTVDPEPVDMAHTDPYLMCLHLPFHQVMFTQQTFQDLCTESDLTLVKFYRRSYMDTMWPFVNRRFLEEFSKGCGHNIDKTFDPKAGRMMFTKPILWFYAFFGYFFPSAYEPAVVLRKHA